jgi:hypothetical protein
LSVRPKVGAEPLRYSFHYLCTGPSFVVTDELANVQFQNCGKTLMVHEFFTSSLTVISIDEIIYSGRPLQHFQQGAQMSLAEKELPPQVAAAKARDDVYALTLMGRAGGRTTQRRRDVRKAVEEEYRWRANKERGDLAHQANEDTCPVDDSPMGNIFTGEEFRSYN